MTRVQTQGELQHPHRGSTLSTVEHTLGKALLALEVVAMYARVRWLLLRRGPVEAVPVLRRGLVADLSADPELVRVRRSVRFGRAVIRVLRLLPTDGRCLMRSLVLTGLLARRGLYATVVIGVRPQPSFGAHAWVEVDGRPVLAADESSYQRLVEL